MLHDHAFEIVKKKKRVDLELNAREPIRAASGLFFASTSTKYIVCKVNSAHSSFFQKAISVFSCHFQQVISAFSCHIQQVISAFSCIFSG